MRPGDLEAPAPDLGAELLVWGFFLTTDTALFSLDPCAALAEETEGPGSGLLKFEADFSVCAGATPACRALSVG